jgi:hypothetical protein
MPITGTSTAARMASTSPGPFARIAAAPPYTAATAMRAIVSVLRSGLISFAWHDTMRE